MKKIIYSILMMSGVWLMEGCCEMDDTFCVDQVFTESVNVPLDFTYTVNDNKPFVIAQKLTASDVRRALKVQGNDFKVKKVDFISGTIKYGKDPDNKAVSLYVNLGIVASGGGLEVLLLKERQVLPLFDIPATPFNKAISLNEFLNGNGIKEIKKIVENYATTINEGDISFLLRGEGLPVTALTKFSLMFSFRLSVTYEVCRYAPMGEGERACN